MLTPDEVAQFIDLGFVPVRRAFPDTIAAECREILWTMMGLRPDDPSGWKAPVVRIPGCAAPPFRTAASSPRLRDAYDQLVGEGRWMPMLGLGTFPIRFPHPDDPGDTGWHVDGGYLPDGAQHFHLNIHSKGRSLLALFLLSDVGPSDAPTRIKVGSHLDVPKALEAAEERGLSFLDLCTKLEAQGLLDSPARDEALATGQAGDVFLCHPFLIHAAQPLKSQTPRFIAQPPLVPREPIDHTRADGALSPVEVAIRKGLGPKT